MVLPFSEVFEEGWYSLTESAGDGKRIPGLRRAVMSAYKARRLCGGCGMSGEEKILITVHLGLDQRE